VPALVGLAIGLARCVRVRPGISAELAVLATAAVVLPPLVFFILYFCGLHSPRHLLHAAQNLNRKSAIITAAGVTLLTVVLGGLVVMQAPVGRLDERLLQLTFIGLAVLTVPHMILIEHWAARRVSPAPT